MPVLQRKLWRELWHIRGQALAIMLVIVGGVGVCVMSLSTYHSLLQARDLYYRDYRFADVFVNLKRAPIPVLREIRQFPQISYTQARVVARANLEVKDFNEPIQGLITSIPDRAKARENALNQLHIIKGRLPDHRRDDETVVSEGFANAHQLQPGDHMSAVINGRRRSLQIVGLALSPEHIYQIAPGSVFPDHKRFGVLWMAHKPLAKAYDMDGAFNNLIIQLRPNGNAQSVIQYLDQQLARYGGLGAYDRSDQLSNRFLQEEFNQLRIMAILFPTIFLGVAVFLLNVVITRLINSQRELIAVLKAFGYSNTSVFLHYAQMIIIITGLGVIGGFMLGLWLGRGMVDIYTQYYSFPQLPYSAPPLLLIAVAALTLTVAVVATLRSVYRAAALPPAEAMRPPAPANYHQSLLDRLHFINHLSPPNKMVLRQFQRKPLKALMSVIGLAMASAIMMVGNFQQDAVDFMVHVQFKLTQKQDIEANFNNPVATKALSSIRGLPGVQYVEGLRAVPIRLRYKHHSHRTSLQGLPDERHLQAVLDTQLADVDLPADGLLVTEYLAHKMGFSEGDRVEIETLEGRRQTRRVRVAQLSQQYLGTNVYMRQSELNRLMGEGPAVSAALINIDQRFAESVYQHLREMPQVAGLNLRQTVINSLNESLERVLLLFTFINAILGSVIAFGVVYNTIRIALAERSRELASLRVLGYTRGEVAYILIAEMAVLTLVSIPVGFLIGTGLCQIMTTNLQSDLYRIPLVLSPFTYAFSALVVLVSAFLSAMLVAWRLRQLNLVDALKTRE